MYTRLVESHVNMDLKGIFGVSPGSRSRKNWFHLASIDPNLEGIDCYLTLNDTALSGPEFFSLYWSQSRMDQNFLVSIDPNLECIDFILASIDTALSGPKKFVVSIDPNLEWIDIITVPLIPVLRGS